jgi:hypothetical protein
MRPWGVAVTGLAAPPGFVFLREALAANDCSIAGGGYDYARAVCDMTGFHEYVPFAARHNGLLWYTLALAMVFVSGIVVERLPTIQLYAKRAMQEFARRRVISLAAPGSQDSPTP